MRENGTDRDMALDMVTALDTCKTLIETINDALYAPHIITQPTDAEGAIGGTAVFTVVADHVKAYQWLFSSNNGTTWSNTGSSGQNITDTLSLSITETRLSYLYRCKITGLDNSFIYTNPVKIIETPGT